MLKWILYEWCGLNGWLFLRIHGDDTRPGVAVVMKGLSVLGDYRLVPAYLALGLALTWFLRRSGRGAAANSVRGANWRLLIGYAICFVLVGTLKVTFELPRPDSTAVDGDLRYSLPSGHAAFVALLAMSLWPLLQSRGRVAIGAFVLAVGYSRIWLGSHYPADVVAGYFCGLVAAWLATRIGRTWRMRA